MQKVLRDYQTEARLLTKQRSDAGVKSGLLCLATGMGKTTTSAYIIEDFIKPRNKHSLFLTHREELIKQSEQSIASELYGDLWQSKSGIVKAEKFDITKPLTFGSIQTLHRRLDRIPRDYYEIIVYDEAHLSAAKSWKNVTDHFKPKLLLGLTATPKRLDGISLGDTFQEIIIERDIAYGIKNGWLVELDGVQIRTDVDLGSVRTTGGELNSSDLEKLVNTPKRNNLIADSWLKYTPGQRTLGFCVDVQHAIDITKTFQNRGIKASFICADEKICSASERVSRFQRFSDPKGDIDVLFNVEIATVGVDIPMISCIIMARPTKSLTLYLQAIGRGTRTVIPLHLYTTAEERIAAITQSLKGKCTILDVVDLTSRHSLVNTWTLDKDKETKDKVFKTREFKEMVAAKAGRDAKITHELKEDKKVVLMALPKVVINHSGAMLDPASPAQLKWIADAGYDTENNVFTKADASEIISQLPATDAQVFILKRAGFDISGGVNRGQAGIVIKEIEAKKQRDLEKKFTSTLPFNDLD